MTRKILNSIFMENSRNFRILSQILMPFVWVLILFGLLRLTWEFPVPSWLFYIGLIDPPIFRFDIIFYTYLIINFLILIIIYKTRKHKWVGSSYKISFFISLLIFIYLFIFCVIFWFDIKVRDYEILELLYG